MKRLPFVLFFSGMTIQFAALLGEHATEIPFVLRSVAPAHYRGQKGIETLLQKRKLESKEEGFDEISQFLIWHVYEINHIPRTQYEDFKVDGIWCMDLLREETTSDRREVVWTPDDLRFILSSVTNSFRDGAGKIVKSLEFNYHLSALKQNVEELKETNILMFCFGLFFIGCAIEVVAFLLEHAESKKTERVANNHKANATAPNQTKQQEHPS